LGHRDTVAAFIFLGGGLHFKAIERAALYADTDFGQLGSHLAVKAILVHSEKRRGVAQPHEARGYAADRRRFPATHLFDHNAREVGRWHLGG